MPRAAARPSHRSLESKLKGKTLEWTFDDGPTAGTTYEHRFGADGSISFRPQGATKWTKAPRGTVSRVNSDVDVISYISEQGYTLTAVLDHETGTVTAFASNGTDWFTQNGTFALEGQRRLETPSSQAVRSRPRATQSVTAKGSR